MKSKKLENIHK